MTFSRTDPYWGDGFEVLAISEDSSACAQHERQRAGGVGHQRRGAEGEQGGEGEERATAGQGIDRPGGSGVAAIRFRPRNSGALRMRVRPSA